MTNGILLLDKPLGLSSNAAVQRVRHACGRVKAGHTGSLDPLATGMLPICLGEATKVAGFLLEGDKEYLFTAQFGTRTATGDLEGEVVERCDVPADLRARLLAALPAFTGDIRQIPPMYSALKRDGQPLYRLARQGIEVERASRQVTIRSLELLETTVDQGSFRVVCSKGTYVRTLAEDLARAIGSCAHLTALRRTAVEPFSGEPLFELSAVQADPSAVRLLPADAALPHLPRMPLDAEATRRIRLGQALRLDAAQPGLVRLYAASGAFLGIGQIEAGASLKPVRLFNDLAP